MDRKFIIEYDIIGDFPDALSHHESITVISNADFPALISAQNIIKAKAAENGYFIKSSYECIKISVDDSLNDDYVYINFTIREKGHLYGYNVETVFNCADGDYTIALVNRRGMVDAKTIQKENEEIEAEFWDQHPTIITENDLGMSLDDFPGNSL